METAWPKTELLPVEQLETDTYQRDPNEAFIGQIAKDFDPRLFVGVVVSRRDDGKCAVIDGQHRVAAAKLRGVTEVPSFVLEGLTLQEEAGLFCDYQKLRRGVAAFYEHRARLIRKDPIAIQIDAICREAGIRFVLRRSSTDPVGATSGVSGFYRAYSRYGRSALRRACLVYRQAWPDELIDVYLIMGTAEFIKMYSPDEEKLALKLSRFAPKQILKNAAMVREGKNLGNAVWSIREVIESIYNRRVKK